MIKIAYKTSDERNQIIESKLSEGLKLIEEQNISEGNFLIFGNESTDNEPTEAQILLEFIVDVDYRVSRLELGM